MKKITMAIIACVALTACSDDEVVSKRDDNTAIRFRSAVTNASRATAVTTANLSEFWVKAVNASDNTNFWSSTTDGFVKFVGADGEYSGTGVDAKLLKWPKNDVTLNFTATNLDPTTYPITVSGTTQQYVNFTPKLKVSEQVDLVYATNKGTRVDFTSSVPLVFKHALCQVEIQALCNSTEYTVKVKGYKIHHMCDYATFTLPTPAQYLDATATTASGSWALHSVDAGVDYVSDWYGDYAVSDNSTHDTSGNYLELTATAQQIRPTDGTAMVIPAGNYSGYNIDNNLRGGKLNKGFYIALLVQVDKNDTNKTPIYPAKATGSDARISYKGLPKYYGYIYYPITIDWQNYVGKKLTYVFDLSSGLGFVDPSKPTTVDPSTYDPTTDTDDGTGGTDPYQPTDQVLGSVMLYNMNVSEWSTGEIKEEL
jgi:hypothetical protein